MNRAATEKNTDRRENARIRRVGPRSAGSFAPGSSRSMPPWHRLDHLDTAAMADVRQPGRQRGVGDEGLDLADMGDADRRATPQFRAVGDQHDAARIGDDGLRRLHLAIVEIQQRALLVDRGGADMA